jgi:alkanesulfonate monooxygenase SsuD/methylene tetrahydromethanopterin reductase-like flavin-dependent oxidoreductase (luciferase family)
VPTTADLGFQHEWAVALGILRMWAQRPVGCLFVVPLWHPVLMAGQIGALAAIAAAPFIIQAGAGDGRAQFAAMGKDLRGRAVRTERGIRLVQALLDGETVDDEEWNIKGAHFAPRPAHGTEWWIGGRVQRSIDRAARLGTCWYGHARSHHPKRRHGDGPVPGSVRPS